MMMKTEVFDVIDYLHNEEQIQGYLLAVLESGANHETLKDAFRDAERARAKLQNQEPNMASIEMILNVLMNDKFTITARV